MRRGKQIFSSVICSMLLAAAPVLAADSKKEFVGSEKCKRCHSEEFKSWKGTFHAKIVLPKKTGILKDEGVREGRPCNCAFLNDYRICQPFSTARCSPRRAERLTADCERPSLIANSVAEMPTSRVAQ